MTKEEALRMIDEEQAKHKCYIEFDKDRITAENQGELAKFIDTAAKCEKADSGMYIICELARQYVELPRGKWIYHHYDHDYECSSCKSRLDADEKMPLNDVWDFCPNCGARMGDEE